MSLEKAIAHWDGKSAEYMVDLYKGYVHEATFVQELVAFCGQPTLQIGATWLIKHHLENGGALGIAAVNQIYLYLSQLESWGAKLHMLQSIPYWTITADAKSHVEAFVRNCLTNQNKFVRAWAYNGFNELAILFPEYQAEVNQLLEQGLEEEAASVKARIRNILKLS